MNKLLRVTLGVKYVNNVLVINTNKMYILLKIFKFDAIYSYLLIKFHYWCCNIRTDMYEKFLAPLIPVHNYNVLINRLNYPRCMYILGGETDSADSVVNV